MNSKQLWAQRRALVDRVGVAVENEDHDEAHRIEGEIRALDVVISQVIDEEDAARTVTPCNVLRNGEVSFAESLFGARDQFSGIAPGFKQSAPYRAAASTLPTPQVYRSDLPAPVAPPIGFIDTILHGTTEGDEHFFKTPVLTNAAAGWTSGEKPESSLQWTEGVANLETIAHWIPIKKQTARRYGMLESITSGALMLGLKLKQNEYALRGSNSSGIVGVTNTAGILTHTKATGKNLKDTFAAMKRKVRVASGIAPGYVCLSPYAIEELSEEKDTTGRYLFPDIADGGTIAGLTVVEDVNMTVVTTTTQTVDNKEVTTTTSKETALVYYAGGASFDIADPEEVTIGLVDSQLIENEYTLLAELTAALRVDIPAAFCYCGDLGIAAEA